RRGAAGEAPRAPAGPGSEHVSPEDLVLTDYPRGYLIPAGPDQRSQVAAARLVGHLLANDVEVRRLASPSRVAGVTHPAGTYVVDLHQAKRGMARALLGPGSDLSGRVHRMYDVSGWSHALLWGADVVTVPAGSTLSVTTEPLDRVDATGSVAGPGDLVLRLDDPADLVAVNALLGSGADVRLLEDGSAVVAERHRRQAEALAVELGVTFGAVPAGGAGTAVEPITVA